jgi:predicted metalloprotease
MSPEKVREKKGIPADRELADFERPVLVKAMDFATALTTEQLRADKDTKGVQKISKMNADNHKGARNMIMDAGLNPEILEHDGDIRHVEHRAEKQRVKLVSRNNNDTSD